MTSKALHSQGTPDAYNREGAGATFPCFRGVFLLCTASATKNRTSAIATFPVPVKEKRFVTLFIDFPALENSRVNYMREKQHVRTTGLENMELKADREGVKQRVTETAVFTKLHFSLDIHPYN